MKLGVCYYPEQWPRDLWADDARRIAELGISLVRVAEFSWSRLEPNPGEFDFEWLDRILDLLGDAGLQVILGTPTATPPKWLVDAHPEILAVDSAGLPRRFGSRRHYCFSSEVYRVECARIVEALARRYGEHQAIVAWQIDNEFGCHDTTISYSPAAVRSFRQWLAVRYGSPDALNAAWGAVFWSQEYRSFDEVDPPFMTVTEANPSHRLDYNRFASDEVARFCNMQVGILRRYSPGRDITHNFMGFYTEFDHFEVAAGLDLATWDSYPLGFLEMFGETDAHKAAYMRQGDPDVSAFHHDLYRACGGGRWGVMEQQPGPVNWARYNPAPLAGMVRCWTWEAFAHGAELVSYFRWRQAPFAQEQMHTGLNRPDNVLDIGGEEAAAVATELKEVGVLKSPGRAPVAFVFSYEADWHSRIQPHGASYRWFNLALDAYRAVRRLGVDVDIVSPSASLDDYRLIVVPSLPIVPDDFPSRLVASGAVALLGPRTGSRTIEGHIPANLPPGVMAELLSLKVVRVESLRPGASADVMIGGKSFAAKRWREWLETSATVHGRFADGGPAWIAAGPLHYLATWPEEPLFDAIMARLFAEGGLVPGLLEPGVRMRSRAGVQFAFNYAADSRSTPAPPGAEFLIGGPELPSAGVAAWKL